MKKLSIEEKAKRYDEVVAMAKECITYIPDEAVNKYMLNMFPELKESGDEKIRKAIIDIIKSQKEQQCHIDGAIYDEMIAWLEKQGEQKSADKVEPKFKIGDWIIYNRNDHSRKIMQIYDIRDNRYYFNDNIHFSWSVKECDEKSHLWAIEDAEEGDVLCLGGVIAIFKKYISQEKCICYCSFCDNGSFEIPIENGEDNVYGCTNTTPATKEQRDTLEKEMIKAGYKWDANKKELIRINV